MNEQTWAIITSIAQWLLVPIVTALGIWGGKQVKKWEVKSDLKTMKQNATDAVQAIEQLYPNETGEVKKKLALTLACQLNKVAGIVATDTVQLALNESSVLVLPSTGSSTTTTNTAGNIVSTSVTTKDTENKEVVG
jgi:hypothetical protein